MVTRKDNISIIVVLIITGLLLVFSPKVLIAQAAAPDVTPNIQGQVGYEVMWLNNDHGLAKIYYPPAVIYPKNAYPYASTVYPIFVLSSKEVYRDGLTLYDTDFTFVKWEVWAKWSHRDMGITDKYGLDISGFDLGPNGNVDMSFSISVGTTVSGSISMSGEGPDTTSDLNKRLETLSDVSGVWVRLGSGKTSWDATWTSVKQKGFYLFGFSNSYMDDYVNTNYKLYLYNRVTMNWKKYLLPVLFPIGETVVTYRFIIGDDIPSTTDSLWLVREGTFSASWPQP